MALAAAGAGLIASVAFLFRFNVLGGALGGFDNDHFIPKVLALACGAWAVRSAALQPTTRRLALAALVTAAASLFRHDLGVYVAAAMGAALIARDIDRWRLLLRHAGMYGALTVACLLPSVIWVQAYEGLPEYLGNAAASVAAEQGRTNLRLPPIDVSAPLAPANLEVAGYYTFWAVAIAGAAVLFLRLAWWRGPRLAREARAAAFGLLALAALANLSFLRANLAERFGDAVVAVALLAAWIAGTASLWQSAVVRRLVVIAPSVLLVGAFGASYILSEVGRELDTSGLSDSWEETTRRYRVVQDELRGMPPAAWTDADARGTLVAARYVAACTRPTDRLLGIGPVHEIHVFARRGFAAGQAMFKLSLYTSVAFQRRALERLAHESVPLVIADVEEYRYFDDLYPLVARHLTERYRDAGSIEVDGRPRFRVLVSADRAPTRADPVLGLPCFA